MRTPVDSRRLPRIGSPVLLLLFASLTAPLAQAAVPGTVDLLPTPPEITASVAPNVALTFDDSGSMAWQFMPDRLPYRADKVFWNGVVDDGNTGVPNVSAQSSSSTSQPWFCAGRFNADITDPNDPRSRPMNGMYYDKNVTYRPPYKSDGVNEFPPAVFADAWNNGITHNRPTSPDTTLGTRNLGTSGFCRTAQPLADATYFQLDTGDFNQDWTDTGLITATNNWTGVPHLYGYGSGRTQTPGMNPNTSTLLSYTTGTFNVAANQSNATVTTGGIFEMDRGTQFAGNPTIAMQGSSAIDAPYLLLRLNTKNCTNVQITYLLRDLGNTNAVQQIGLQARASDTGNFTALTLHPNANNGGVTAGSWTLDSSFEGKDKVQIRWMTTDAASSTGAATNDNMIGIDDIRVTGTCTPVDRNAGYYQYKTSAPLAQDANGVITTPSTDIYNVSNWEWVPLPVSQRQNFANWYSYYRTRSRSAATAMSRAFQPFDANIRVIWQNLGARDGNGNLYNPLQPLLVDQPIYKFEDDSVINNNVRTRFYDWLFSLPTDGGTPNVSASIRVGEYFKRAGGAVDTNPYWDRNYLVPAESRELSCRQNFHINMSDGFWNSGNPHVGGAATARRYVGTGVTLPDGRVYNTGNPETRFFHRFTGDPISPTLTDVMFHYWASDLRPDFTAADATKLKVPPFIPDRSTNLFGIPLGSSQDPRSNREIYWNPANDPATWSHLVNFNISFGLEGTLPQTPNVLRELRLGESSTFRWPYPVVNTDDGRKLDDFWHAALASRGRFLSAKNPGELIDSLQEVIASIVARRGASTAVSVSLPIITDGTTGYTAGYDTTDWAGFFTRNTLDPLTAERVQVLWDAGCILTGGACASTAQTGLPVRDPDSRVILTSSGTLGSGKPFRWSELTAAQQARLNVDPTTIDLTTPSWTADAFGQRRVEYLRGVRTNEATPSPRFRTRSSVLGAVIRGQPIYVSSPTAGYPDTFPAGSPEVGNSYAAFQVAQRERPPTVYVAANDGMLHAFNGANGNERWAYVPNTVIENFRLTRSTKFEGGFTPSVDDKPLVTDVFMNGAWRTVLLGSMRLGGRGVYLLDITNVPSSTATESALASTIPKWEFSNVRPSGDLGTDCGAGARHCSSLGYTYESVNIARIKYQNKWVALVSSGYFPIEGTDPASYSPKANQTSLLVIDLETGQLIREILTSTSPDAATQSFGLSQAIVMDTGTDFIDDVAIAGDLAGNLWRFDLSGATPGEWKVDLMFTTYGAGGGPAAATAGAVGERPIASAPIVMKDSTGREPIIVFGSGKFIGSDDRASTIQQSFYGVEDYGTCTANNAACDAYPIRPNQLTVRKIVQAGNAVREISALFPETPPTTSRGWRIRLDVGSEAGERSLDTPFPFYSSNQVLLRSIIPKSVNPCDPGARYGLMVVNAADGGPDVDPADPSGSRRVGGVVSSSTPPGDPITLRGGGNVVIAGLTERDGVGAVINQAVVDAINASLSNADDIWHRGAWRDLQQ